jgi:hypothetical protein
MLNPLPLKRNAQIKTLLNGHLLETEVRIWKIKKCWTHAGDIKVEIPLSGLGKVKSKVTLRSEKPHGMPTKINDRQRNQINDDQIPKWTIHPIKLDSKGPWIVVEPKQINWRL